MSRGGMSFELEGFEELGKALKEMGRKVGRRTMRKAITEAAQKMEAALKAAAPVRSGTLKDSIVLKSSSRKGTVGYELKGEYYGRFIEFGYTHFYFGRKIGFRGAQPWIRPTFESLEAQLRTNILTNLEAEILKVWKKHIKTGRSLR